MHLSGQQMPFGREARRSSLRRAGLWLALIALGVLVLYLRYVTRVVEPLFLPQPTPTRTALSFAEEGKTYFSAGDLEKAIQAYQQAVGSGAHRLAAPGRTGAHPDLLQRATALGGRPPGAAG